VAVTGLAGGQLQFSTATNRYIYGVQFVDSDNSGSRFNISLSGTSGTITTNVMHDQLTVDFTNNAQTDAGATLAKSAANGGVITVGDANTGQINVRFDPFADYSSTGTDRFVFGRTGGSNAIETYASVSLAGAATAAGTYLVSAVNNTTYALYAFDNDRYTSMVNGGMDQDVALLAARGARLHEDGTPANNTWTVGQYLKGEDLDDGTGTNPLTNVRFTLGGGILKASETAVFDVSTSNTVRAGTTTTLASITAIDAAGAFDGGSQQVDFYLSGRTGKATVILNGNDTLEDMAGKFSLALWNPEGGGLLQEEGILSSEAPPDLVRVNNVGAGAGAISIAAPLPGQELIISADDDLLDAFNLSEVAAAVAPTFSVSATNVITGEKVGSTLTTTSVATGVVDGIDIRFNNSVNLRLDPEPGSSNTNTDFPYWKPDEAPAISITGSGDVDEFYMHVAPNPFTLQVGADTGHSLDVLIPQVNTSTLGLAGLNVATQETASTAISQADHALGKLGVLQGRIGAYENRLQSAADYLDVAAENTMAAESRIRDTDYAEEIINLTRAQVASSSAEYALVQANLNAKSVLSILSV
jgi:flagellin-like hook-associated protein FlgL